MSRTRKPKPTDITDPQVVLAEWDRILELTPAEKILEETSQAAYAEWKRLNAEIKAISERVWAQHPAELAEAERLGKMCGEQFGKINDAGGACAASLNQRTQRELNELRLRCTAEAWVGANDIRRDRMIEDEKKRAEAKKTAAPV